jgi:hydrogenase maturation protease
MDKTLVVCIGNDLVADDGVGRAVYDLLLQKDLPSTIRIRFLGIGGLELLEEMAGERALVVVDAVQFGSEPGTVHIRNWEDIPENTQRPVSGHGIGIREAIEIGRRLTPEKMPVEVYLVGIEGRCFDTLGAELSPEVARAAQTAVDEIINLIG